MNYNRNELLTACEYNNVDFNDLAAKVGLDNLYNLHQEYPWIDLLDYEIDAICKELNTVKAFFKGFISDDLLFEGALTLDKYNEAVENNTLHDYFISLGLEWWVNNKTTKEIDDALFKTSTSTLTRPKMNSLITFLNTATDRYLSTSLLPANEDVYINLVKNKPLTLKEVKFQTEKIALAAVNKFAHAIEFVDTQTEKIALAAVVKNGLTLEFVEPQFHTDTVVKAAIKQNPLSFQFSTLKTEEICSIAVEANGINYEFVPNEFRTHELKMAALQSNGWSIKFFDEQTEEYALTAVIQNPETILHIDEEIRENNQLLKLMYIEIVKKHDFLLKYIN